MMKKVIFSLIATSILSLSSYAQAPEGFKYQAVVRDAAGTILSNQTVGIQMTIQQGTIGGTAVYTETFAPMTNAYGLVNLEIGSGTTVDDFSTIDWSNGPYFIETAFDATGGANYVVMGTSQLMSVPYALHANTAESVINDLVDDADADPNNETNTGIALTGTSIEITDADGTLSQDLNGVFATDAELAALNVNDADADPNNETNTGLSLNGTSIEVTDADGTLSQDLNGVFATDAELAALNVNDADADPNNETNTGLSLNGTSIEVTDADGTLSQDLNGTFATDAELAALNVNDADADPTNEIQTINRTGTTVTLSNGGGSFQDSVGVYTAGDGIDITNNVVSVANTCGLSIGDTYEGGIIFYLDPSGCHGLISAASDQSTGIQWYNGSDVDTYAYGNGVGSGHGNGNAVRRWQGTCSSCYANELCLDLSLNGYTDWYLPSEYELILMYENIGQGNVLGLGNIGNFAANIYWSSTEYDQNEAWWVSFTNGNSGDLLKLNSLYVRAVRAF